MASQQQQATAPASSYRRVVIDGDEGDAEFKKCAPLMANVIKARMSMKAVDRGQLDAYHGSLTAEAANITFEKGIFNFEGRVTPQIPFEKYCEHFAAVYKLVEDGPCLSVTRARLKVLEERFELYRLLNTDIEESADRKRRGGGVFANGVKVDYMRLRACVNATTLLETVVTTATEQPQTLALEDTATGATLTLQQLLDKHRVGDPSEITAEGLGIFPPAMSKRYHQFDAFDEKHNATGSFGAEMLRVFLQRTGPNDGLLFASLLRPVLEKLEYAPLHVTAAVMRVPISGTHESEWKEATRWLRSQGLNGTARCRWSVDIVRSANTRAAHQCRTYADQLHHIFYPMLMATLSPASPEWVDVAAVLRNVTSLTISSDETVKLQDAPQPPDELSFSAPADDYYFFYYVWANLCTLNALRKRNGMNTLTFMPTCPFSSRHLDHLVSSFLLADAIYDGTKLYSCWFLQYLFMFSRVGIIMSPLMDNSTHTNYFDHPFPIFFKRGLCVTLATIDPLHYHHNPSAVIEEYATAQKVYDLTPMDMCELARNACLMSNYPHEMLCSWLGSQYQSAFEGNDITRTNVADCRLFFRHDCLLHEQGLINFALTEKGKNTDNPNVLALIRPRTKAPGQQGGGGGGAAADGGGAGGSSAAAAPNVNEGDGADGGSLRVNNSDIDTRIMYPRIDIAGPANSTSAFTTVGELLQTAISLRNKFDINVKSDVTVEDVFLKTNFNETIHEYNSYHGVFQISRIGRPPDGFRPPFKTFKEAMEKVREIAVNTPDVVRLAQHRLELLEHKFMMHKAMNVALEAGEQKNKERDNRDIFTAHKIDNNCHTTALMNSRTLLEFFSDKATSHGQDVVCEENHSPVTLREMLERYKIDPSRLAVDELHAMVQSNPQIRSIFLSTDNFMQGRYFAELTKKTLELYKLDEFTFAESRLQIFGKNDKEWHNLAMWFDRYGMASHQNRWIVSLPRGYAKLRKLQQVRNFAEYLDNLFQPLWEVSLHPAQDPKFHYFLTHVSGFDCVDDESKVDLPLEFKEPHDWANEQNPPYSYYMYYYWANLMSLNSFRAKRGLSTFTFRPQCGELGDVDHLIAGFLLASSINQGVTLRHYPAMEYLYYIAQIPIAMSPLSNTRNSIQYLDNPFPKFYYRGLRVGLSTDQPLFTHFTREPLLEEYSIASKIWTLESNDLCEIARNSVLQSGFGPSFRSRALGPLHYLNSTLGNDVARSRVSDVRVAYRFEVYHAELTYLDGLLQSSPLNVQFDRAILTYKEEVDEYDRVMEETLLRGGVAAAAAAMGRDGGGGGSGRAASTDATSAASLKAAAMHDKQRQLILQKQHEIETKQKELLLLRTYTNQLSAENDVIATQIKMIQERLEKETLVLRADLVNEGRAADDDADDYDSYGDDYGY